MATQDYIHPNVAIVTLCHLKFKELKFSFLTLRKIPYAAKKMILSNRQCSFSLLGAINHLLWFPCMYFMLAPEFCNT